MPEFLAKYFRHCHLRLTLPFQGAVLRERDRIRGKVLGVDGLMPLLMKQRNGQRWTRADLKELYVYAKQLSALSPYVIVLLLPGSFCLLPLLAWGLDRRQHTRTLEGIAGSSPQG